MARLEIDLAIIGGGQMGEALIKGILASGTLRPDQIVVSEPDSERRSHHRQTHRVDAWDDNKEAANWGDVVLLAVKPQHMDDVLYEIGPRTRSDQIVVSIAAGVTTARIESAIPVPTPVVRVMPNSPALLGKAISVVSGGAYADDRSLRIVRRLLSSVGKVLVMDESLQNGVTALSGSGPAYFYYLVEALIDAGVGLGLHPEAARELTLETMSGAAAMLTQTRMSPEELRAMVTSPGGTTEAGMKVFERRKFKGLIQKVLEAAAKRAGQLSR